MCTKFKICCLHCMWIPYKNNMVTPREIQAYGISTVYGNSTRNWSGIHMMLCMLHPYRIDTGTDRIQESHMFTISTVYGSSTGNSSGIHMTLSILQPYSIDTEPIWEFLMITIRAVGYIPFRMLHDLYVDFPYIVLTGGILSCYQGMDSWDSS